MLAVLGAFGRGTRALVTGASVHALGAAFQRRAGFDSNSIVVVLRVAARAQPPRLEANEDGADELAEACGVHRLHVILGAVLEVMRVQRRPRQRHTFGRFVIVKKPFHLRVMMIMMMMVTTKVILKHNTLLTVCGCTDIRGCW